MDYRVTDNRDLAVVVSYLEDKIEALEREIVRLKAELLKTKTVEGRI